MRPSNLLTSSLVLLSIIIGPWVAAQQSTPTPRGVEALTDLSRLPVLDRNIWFGSVSSQDVTGGNEDGFAGVFSYLYTERNRWVLLDIRGPACLYLIRPIRAEDVFNPPARGFGGNLYIESGKKQTASEITLPFADLFSGKQTPFLQPLVRDVTAGHGSAWSFVPVCEPDGIKLSRDEPEKNGFFYNIFYHRYGEGTKVAPFSSHIDVGAAVERWKEIGKPFDSRPAEKLTRTLTLPAQTAVPVWSVSEPGTISAVYVRLPKQTYQALRHVRLRAYWDDDAIPSIDSPLGPFFGTGYWPVSDLPDAKPRYGFAPKGRKPVEMGRIPTQSLPVGLDKDQFYCFFPMPFEKSARFELVNESDIPLSGVAVTIHVVKSAPATNSGYFHALWHEEDPTRPYRDYTVLETTGYGKYVGAVLVMSSVHFDPAKTDKNQRLFLEGDARFYIDDNRTFANAGTGTEEYFLWGGYDLLPGDQVFNFPVSGYPFHDIDTQDHTVMYRFHLSDWVPYYRSFLFALEHGDEGEVPSHYSSTAFFYQRGEPVLDITDMMTFGDAQSEQAHSYQFGNVLWGGSRILPFEGDRQIVYNKSLINDQKNGTVNRFEEGIPAYGRRANGTIEFTISISPSNSGVKLRRLLDYAPADIPEQELIKRTEPRITPSESAQVYVDGQEVGEWYLAPRHARYAWLEDEFEIPRRFTDGKPKLRIRLEVAPESRWSAFQYHVYSYRPIP